MENRERDENISNDRLEALRYNNLGFEEYKKVNFDDAIAEYTKAIELDPDLSVAYYNRGTVLYRLGQYNLAVVDLEKAVKLDPKNIEFLTGLEDCRNFSTR
ncbi:hypothetical protein RUM44_003386 [Polyplax serrata]|uniref:Tetratricopeptide repeat protein n=1 Tax=Polyplax serrata TaxID=468196 RepID=A0ABR1AGB6_POLSC